MNRSIRQQWFGIGGDRAFEFRAGPATAGRSRRGAVREDHALVDCLKAGGFLVPDVVDQAGTLQAAAKRLQRMGSILGLTIAPTLACNFRCEYCFEARSHSRMSESTQEALLAFCDRYLERADALRVWWFGGEPTIAMPILERIQTRLLALADKHQVDVDSGEIITNGYLLNAAMARQLREMQITRAQVTIDGPEQIHDQRRKLADGRGTYRRILDNLNESADLMEIEIRINVDRENAESACEVVETLHERGILSRVKVHFGQVRSFGNACVDIRNRCFSDLDFSQAQVRIYERLHEKGLYLYQYPAVRAAGVSCAALADGYYVVGPDGHMYKCWEDLSHGPPRAIGTVFDTTPADSNQKQNVEAYRSWDPFTMEDGRTCKILPVCMGGCPAHSIRVSEGKRGQCIPARYLLGEVVAIRYRSEINRTATP